MRLIIHSGKVLEIEMRVDLRSRNVGMPQELLNRSKVTAGFEQMAGEGVAQHMRGYLNRHALLKSPMPDPHLHRPASQTLPFTPDKHRGLADRCPLAPQGRPLR